MIRAGPDGAIAWRDRVRIVATQLQPWRQHGIDVPDPNLANMAVMIAEAGRLTKACHRPYSMRLPRGFVRTGLLPCNPHFRVIARFL